MVYSVWNVSGIWLLHSYYFAFTNPVVGTNEVFLNVKLAFNLHSKIPTFPETTEFWFPNLPSISVKIYFDFQNCLALWDCIFSILLNWSESMGQLIMAFLISSQIFCLGSLSLLIYYLLGTYCVWTAESRIVWKVLLLRTID